MNSAMKRSLLFFLMLSLVAAPALAGRISLLVKGSKWALKAGAKEAAKATAEKVLLKRTEALTARYGRHSLERASEVAVRRQVHPQKLLSLIEAHGDVLARHGFSEEALMFVHKHGGVGIFFLRHQALWDGLRKSVDVSRVDRAVLVQAWRWGDEKAIGGSVGQLRSALQKAGMNSGRSRDFCEDLFMVKARSGKVPGISRGSELIKGHLGDEVTGIDFLLPENGKLRAIEFGTGKKPGAGELSWERIRKQLAAFVESRSPDQVINLRAKGFPNELLLNPVGIRSGKIPIDRWVVREIYAPQLDMAELARVGNVVAQQIR